MPWQYRVLSYLSSVGRGAFMNYLLKIQKQGQGIVPAAEMRQMTPKASILYINFISIIVESEEKWNMVDDFVRKILEFKGGELKS